MTSNIGSTYLLDGINADGDISTAAREMVEGELKNHFRPEFINRLDEIIMFKPLTKDNITHIIDLLITNLNKRIEDKGISIEISKEAKEFIVKQGYDPVYGARPLKRYLQKTVETLAAKLILSDSLKEGDNIKIVVENNELIAKN